jgi:hypothetical protein
MMMNLMTTKEAAKKWGITVRRVQGLCVQGLIDGATRLGDIWVMPRDAEKPPDGRTKTAKLQKRVFEYPEVKAEKLMVAEENGYYRKSNS